jgi:benzoyl-CoA reductase/2-hydroxyglutaryl-CoA dehydratase subunit BcrC/BadD/HgdB
MGTGGESIEELRKRFEERDKKIAQHRKEVTRRHYEDIQQAREKGIPVAYTTGASPMEILYTMGVQPCAPENYVTITCARQQAERFLEAAETRGMSRDLCSYSRVGLGLMYLEDGPYGALPKPDFIFSYPLICDPHAKWWEVEARYFDVPLISLDGPFRFRYEVEEHEVKWMVEEFKKIFAAIERITGHKFDYDRFKEVMRLSSQARELFQEITEYRKAIPCPRGLREIVGDLFYIVTQLGTQEAVDYFTMVRDDVKERVEHGIGVVPEEKFRLIWDNIVLWYRLQLIDYFSEQGAVFVIDTYPTANWTGFHFDGKHLDPEKPFESLALIQLYGNAFMSLDLQMKRFERMVREWHCDGAVFHSNRGCQILSRAVQEKERMFRERTGALTMSFEAEMADPRSLHEAEVKARIDSFLEMLEGRKAAV